MKKNQFTLALVAMLVCSGAIVLSSCSKDASDIIVGKWKVTALSYTCFGSPNSSQNYSSYQTMENCQGCGVTEYQFYRDNTGMRITSNIGSGTDTMHFTYSIAETMEGVITPMSDGQDPDWTTTMTIQIVDARRITIFEKSIAEDYHDYSGDTTAYTRLIETYNYCKKK